MKLLSSSNCYGKWKWGSLSSRCSASCPKKETVCDISIFHTCSHSLEDSSSADPLVHYGCHFGWTVHAMCSIHTLIVMGLLHATKIGESDLTPDEAPDDMWVFNISADSSILRTDMQYFSRERQQYRVFTALCSVSPNLEDCILGGDDKEVWAIADLVGLILECCLANSLMQCKITSKIQRGSSGARSDDTKSLKGTIVNWITPKGKVLIPHLDQNVKHDRGFHHNHTSFLLCPMGEDWNNQESAWFEALCV